MIYKHINLDYLEKHANGNEEIIAEMLRLSILNVKLYLQEITQYHLNKSWYLLGESAYWAKEKLPLVGLTDLSLLLSELEKLTHQNKADKRIDDIVAIYRNNAPLILEELDNALQKIILQE
jgi:hypothetical protein